MQKFQDKYRIASARRPNWDYRWEGAYFITICTKNRFRFFGEVENGVMIVNEIGKLTEQFWAEIPAHFSVVELGNFVVMPNHIHGVLILKPNSKPVVLDSIETLHCNVSTPPNGDNDQLSKISPKSGSISAIIRSYKSVVSKYAHFINPQFAWQERFHDRIIRSDDEYQRIANYIDNNPAKWRDDGFNI